MQDKILQSVSGKELTVTNDGATILKSVYVDNPAAKVLVDISKTQDDEVGDGTTSVVVLAGELLREAEQLVNQKIHPMVIIAGFREAAEVARRRLEAIATDNGKDPAAFRNDLVNIAKTTLSSKILTSGEFSVLKNSIFDVDACHCPMHLCTTSPVPLTLFFSLPQTKITLRSLQLMRCCVSRVPPTWTPFRF